MSARNNWLHKQRNMTRIQAVIDNDFHAELKQIAFDDAETGNVQAFIIRSIKDRIKLLSE